MYENPTIDARNDALIGRSGVYADGAWSTFDHLRVTEDVAHSFFRGDRPLHPWDGDHSGGSDRHAQGRHFVGQVAPLRHPDPGPYAAGGRDHWPAKVAAGTGPVGASGFRSLFVDMPTTGTECVRPADGPHARGASTTWVMDWMSPPGPGAGRSTPNR